MWAGWQEQPKEGRCRSLRTDLVSRGATMVLDGLLWHREVEWALPFLILILPSRLHAFILLRIISRWKLMQRAYCDLEARLFQSRPAPSPSPVTQLETSAMRVLCWALGSGLEHLLALAFGGDTAVDSEIVRPTYPWQAAGSFSLLITKCRPWRR